ncbi:MAG: hypothetical protein NWE98_02165 [Candidatus Bathyarchaeota archaeon]|nr:hypothetical protein [Candidatus Bathyarchaeota archaeon]
MKYTPYNEIEQATKLLSNILKHTLDPEIDRLVLEAQENLQEALEKLAYT